MEFILVFRMQHPLCIFLFCLFTLFSTYGVSARNLQQARDQCLDSGIFKFIDAGCQSPGVEYEIFGGEVADLNKWPYLMSIQMPQDSGCFFHVCGGALIAADVLVTAAHCVQSGRWLGNDQFEGSPQQTVYTTRKPTCRHLAGSEGRLNIRYISVSSEWSASALTGDIALLFLDTSLPGPYLNYQSFFDLQEGQQLQIAGYGVIKPDDKLDFSRNVRPVYRANLNYISRDDCIRLMEDFGFASANDKLNYQSMLCAHNEYADTCSGDSGGPLVVKGGSPEQDILVGLSSFGPRQQCEQEDQSQAPSAFVRVSYYASWIVDTISKHSGGSQQTPSPASNGGSSYEESGNQLSITQVQVGRRTPIEDSEDGGTEHAPLMLSEEAPRVDCSSQRSCFHTLADDCCQSDKVSTVKIGEKCISQRREYSYLGVCSDASGKFQIIDGRASLTTRGCTCSI